MWARSTIDTSYCGCCLGHKLCIATFFGLLLNHNTLRRASYSSLTNDGTVRDQLLIELLFGVLSKLALVIAMAQYIIRSNNVFAFDFDLLRLCLRLL